MFPGSDAKNLMTFYGKCTAFVRSNNCPYGWISISKGTMNYNKKTIKKVLN